MMKKTYAIIGNPVAHSLSPILHNYWFKKYKIDANYSLLNIEENNLESVTQKIRNKELNGINITLPYKQKIIPFIDRLINDAQLTNSVNTIFLDDTNSLVGENTDVFGLQAAYLKEIINAEKKSALVIGAGGVSPSVIFSLQKSKVKNISIVNRTHDKSSFLKQKFKFLDILDWTSLKDEIKKFDIIINATSLGLKNGNNFNQEFKVIKPNLIYYDIIYNPNETTMIKNFKKKQIQTYNGLEMFIYQGQKSFSLWNEITPELDRNLKNIIESKLK